MTSLYGLLGQLNAAWAYTTSLTGADAQHTALLVGKTYLIQAQGGDVWVGFGATAGAADTASSTSEGLRIIGDAPPTLITITDDSVAYIARTPDSGTTELRICEVVGK